MAITQDHEVSNDGWLEIDPRWVASLFGVQPTGEVKCVLGKVHIGIRAATITKGQVLEGLVAPAFVPMGLKVKGT